MVRLKMAETVKEAVTFIEQGRTWPGARGTVVCLLTRNLPSHPSDVRVGPEPVNDPAYLVTRYAHPA
jgi:ribosomal protein S4